MTGRRILLLVVAGLLTASALLAIGILLVGHFGSTEGRILGTTALLAGYGIVALPAVMLLDQGRFRPLALASATLAVVGAVLALALVWTPSAGDTFGRIGRIGDRVRRHERAGVLAGVPPPGP